MKSHLFSSYLPVYNENINLFFIIIRFLSVDMENPFETSSKIFYDKRKL